MAVVLQNYSLPRMQMLGCAPVLNWRGLCAITGICFKKIFYCLFERMPWNLRECSMILGIKVTLIL